MTAGSAAVRVVDADTHLTGPAANAARSSMSFISNARTLGILLTSGVLDRFPRLDFVSVESGLGPASYAPSPAEAIARDTEIVGEAVMRKVLFGNAARVYHID